jgi:two-component system, cell cycle sensor histidine kinase and response regulator CckA
MPEITVETHPRVLIVDDERHVRFMLCDVLTHWGCEADAATSAADGLERLTHGAYDVLVTDFGMPGMNGLELVERVRKRDPALRVIMLTATGADLTSAAQRLCFTLLHKPFDLARLRTAILTEAVPVVP